MAQPVADFRDRLREAIEYRELKPIELSERTHIAISSISQYLSGYTNPRRERIDALARALNVDPVWLLGFDVPMQKQDNEQLFRNIKDDKPLTDILLKYFECDADTKKRIISVLNALINA